jgi:hypothetical protein
MQASIGGSAKVQGTSATAGLVNMNGTGNSAVKRSKIFWLVAVGVLIVFHVGGARV